MRELVKEIQQQTGVKNIEAMTVDVGNRKKVDEAWAKVISKYGKVNMIVNNAAIARGLRLSEITMDQFQKTLDINVMSLFQLNKLFLSQKSLQQSKTSGEYHIVNVGSVAGHMTSSYNGDYCTSKFAVTGYVSALRQGKPILSLSFCDRDG